MDWIGLGQRKRTHVQLWVDRQTRIMCRDVALPCFAFNAVVNPCGWRVASSTIFLQFLQSPVERSRQPHAAVEHWSYWRPQIVVA